MKQLLYPIGTQLITRRLSQAALYDEIFCWKTIESCVPGGWAKGFSIYGRDRDDYITQWRVTVTEENQKWLSPAFVLELNNAREIIDSKTTYTQEVKDAVYDAFFELGYHRVLRTYPNGQRAPLLEWDEVILPTTGEQL